MTRVSTLWAKAAEMAREGLDPVQAFRKIRAEGGRDLTKDQDEFDRVYARLKAQPLFARHMVLTLARKELQEDVETAVMSVDSDDLNIIDERVGLLHEYTQGSFMALLKLFEVLPKSVADDLEVRARTLWPRLYAQLDAQNAAAKETHAADRADAPAHEQLELPLEPVEPAAVPVVPA
jgi:hypothetical protein